MSGVAGGCHDHDARADGVGGGHGIRVVTSSERRAERHVHDVHAVFDRPVEGGNDHVGRARAAEDAHGVEVDLRGDARAHPEGVRRGRRVVGAGESGAVGEHARATRRAGDVRTVPLAVERVVVGVRHRLVARAARVGVVVVADEVDAALHARRVGAVERRVGRFGAGGVRRLVGGRGAGAAEGGVRVVDAGVDDRDLHTLAGVARALPHLGHAEERHRDCVVESVGAHRVHGDDAGQFRDRVELVGGHGCLHAVVRRLHLRLNFAALVGDLVGDPVLRALQLVFDRLALPVGELAALLGLHDRDGVSGHLDDDRHPPVGADRLRRERRVDRPVRRRGAEPRRRVVIGRRRVGGGGGKGQRDRTDDGQSASVQASRQGCPPFVQGCVRAPGVRSG